MKKTSSLVSAMILLAAAGGTAHAQIYKWVDESGKTHYSDAAPVGGKASTIADKVSYYTPDPALLTRAAAGPSVNPALSDRVDSLERQLTAERMARQQIELAAYTQTQPQAYPDAYYPYAVPVAYPVHHRRPGGFRPSPGPKGTNVVGPGVMPGTYNGPTAVTAGNFTFRTSVSASRGGGSVAFAPNR